MSSIDTVTGAARARFAEWQERLRANRFHADPHLRSLVGHYGRDAVSADLEAFGAECAARLDDLVRDNNRAANLPRLRRYDGIGRRTESIEFHPAYHDIGRAVYGTGVMARYGEPGREWETLALTYLFAQSGEGGHACPLACTAGLIKILQASDGDHGAWLERLLDPDYDTHFHGSQFLTEVQGGSDVGANAVIARPDAHGTWRLHGEKWFCSVIDAQLFLVTARPEGAPPGTRGLKAFAVPRVLDDGRTNAFAVRRLKDKLGTRSMASAEVDFTGALAVEVGDFRRVVEVVLNTSRLYNAVVSCGLMQRAWAEADAYARTRLAFGQPILAFPGVARIVARLKTEAYAARASSFLLADLADRMARGDATEEEQAGYRMLVNLNKYWTSYAGTSCIRDAIEVLGGNGAIEEFTVLPRLLRDSIVCEAWEGGHNVLCAQVLRDSRRYGLHHPMFALLEHLGGRSDALDTLKAHFEACLALPDEAAAVQMRSLADALRPVAQAAALRAEEASAGSDPAIPGVVDHLLTLGAPGYSPLSDPTLMERVRALTA